MIDIEPYLTPDEAKTLREAAKDWGGVSPGAFAAQAVKWEVERLWHRCPGERKRLGLSDVVQGYRPEVAHPTTDRKQ
jgi:hypothetical protein